MTESGEAVVPVAQELIGLLYANETQRSQQEITEIAERVFEALRVRLSSVLGAGGYSTLLTRSLALTRTEFSWLADVTTDKNGSLIGRLGVTAPEQDPAEAAHGFAALLTTFAALLTTFIGADLTNRLLQVAWQDLQEGDKNETRGKKTL